MEYHLSILPQIYSRYYKRDFKNLEIRGDVAGEVVKPLLCFEASIFVFYPNFGTKIDISCESAKNFEKNFCGVAEIS